MIQLTLSIMYISDNTFLEISKKSGLLEPDQVNYLQKENQTTHKSLQKIAIDQNIISAEDLTRAFSDFTGIPYAEIDPKEITQKCLDAIPERVAKQYHAIIFEIDKNGFYHLAMEDPDDIEAINFLQKQIGPKIRIHIATKQNIAEALNAYRGDVDKELGEIISSQADTNKAEEKVSEEDIAENSPIAKTVNLLLEYAIRSSASDIHIEPREEFIQIRYRIDGVLREVNQLPKNIAAALVSRIKILASLKIDERRVPQDGRFKIKLGGGQFAFRVSTLPTTNGEKVVMRILNESARALTLDELGYWGVAKQTIEEALLKPDGMILVTGPTGSGKSTSLFSVLSRLNTPNVNISTIEDPVEYKISGVNQTQTNNKAGMTFANGLRALLRQDPNIIMVGEIRDGETANLAVQAALTGHLVFSTLHTNNAATTLPRLLDMDIEPFLIASTVKAVVGQRLVRKLDDNTKSKYIPTEEEKQNIAKLFNLKPEETFKKIHELEKRAKAEGIGGDTELATDENGIKFLWKADENANEDGVNMGYKGRKGIYEVLDISQKIQRLITANATSDEIQDQAISEDMLTMQTDGLIKALRGVTTIEDVLRVTRE